MKNGKTLFVFLTGVVSSLFLLNLLIGKNTLMESGSDPDGQGIAIEMGGKPFGCPGARFYAQEICNYQQGKARVELTNEFIKNIDNTDCEKLVWKTKGLNILNKETKLPTSTTGDKTLTAKYIAEQTNKGAIGSITAVMVDDNGYECQCGSVKKEFPVGAIDITTVENNQSIRGHKLDDQVLTGKTADFRIQANPQLPNNTDYYLKWEFMLTTSGWQGPFNGSPSGVWNFDVPADALHTLNDFISVDARVGSDGPICGADGREMKVLFDVNASDDDHNRSGGNGDANWFRHWGKDHDGAVSNYSASGTVNHFGRAVEFNYGGTKGDRLGEFNSDVSNPVVTLFDKAHSSVNVNWQSPQMTYEGSDGQTINSPQGQISISYKKSGIDLLRQVVEHELRHFKIDLNWEPGGIWYGKDDTDDDSIPDFVEDNLQGIRWDQTITHDDFYASGTDEEVYIENFVQNTNNADHDEDWAFEGKQSSPSN